MIVDVILVTIILLDCFDDCANYCQSEFFGRVCLLLLEVPSHYLGLEKEALTCPSISFITYLQ